MKHAVAMLMAGLLFACSSPTDSRWEGQGMTFSEAATAAVQKVLDASPLHYVGNQVVRFKYDDAGTQREGQVTAYMDGAAAAWYIAPWQCEYAPAGSCTFTASEMILPASAPSTVSMPDLEGTFSWGDLSDADRGIMGPQWNCDPDAELTFVCSWDGAEYRCRIDWGECAGWSFGD